MDPRHLFFDERLKGGCVFCGADPDTRDHVPSKVLLDDPLPQDIPVVPACSSCNAGFSLDEEYFACLVECVICGSTDPSCLRREKARRSLERNAKLKARIEASRKDKSEQEIWMPEMERVRNVVVKLAQGHVAYELYPIFKSPDAVNIQPLMTMAEEERNDFESGNSGYLKGWPEIGTRAFMRAYVAYVAYGEVYELNEWIEVQPGRYRYTVEDVGGVLVRLVLSEYLACTVIWE